MEVWDNPFSFGMPQMKDVKHMSSAEIDMDRRAKAYYESRSDDIRSGALALEFPKHRNRDFDPVPGEKRFH